MKYFARIHGEDEIKEISKDRAKFLLEGAYYKYFVKDILKNGKSFRLQTPWREIWTESDDGKVPMPGFYGVCE